MDKSDLKKSKSEPFLHFQNNIAIEVNTDFKILTGYSCEELIGRTITEINKMLRLESQVKLENIHKDCICYIFTKKYEPREVKIFCKINQDGNDRLYIIKEKRNPRVEDSYPYVSNILPDNDIAVAIYSMPDEILLKANKKYVNYLSVLCNNDENKIGKTLKEFIPHYKGSKYENHIINIKKTGMPVYFKDHNDYAFQDGNQYWDGSLVPIYLKGKIKYIIHTGIDVTERIIRSVTNVIENLELGLLRISYPDFIIKDINKQYYTHLAATNPKAVIPINLKGQCLKDVVVFNDRSTVINDIKNGISKNKRVFSNIKKYNEAIEEKYYKFIYQLIYGLNNHIIEVIVIYMDITEEVKEKEKIEKALKIQDEIYSNVSHELKTPLNVIFSANQMLDFYLTKDLSKEIKDKLISYNDIIKQNCLRQIKLINNILDLSKSNSGNLILNLSNENIVDIVENIVKSVSEYVKSKELRILFETNVEQKVIACDLIMIERVMLNLISNAIKYSNKGDKIYVNVIDKGNIINITVKDTGTGIEKKHLDLIFQRFYQADKSLSRKAEGTGIGLSLIKSIVKLHGGNISVESEVGKGSVFKVELPAKTIEVVEESENFKNIHNNKIEMINIEFSDIYY